MDCIAGLRRKDHKLSYCCSTSAPVIIEESPTSFKDNPEQGSRRSQAARVEYRWMILVNSFNAGDDSKRALCPNEVHDVRKPDFS